MTGDFLDASLGPQSGVSPFRAVAGADGVCLSDDVLLDDGQWCASAGYSEGRRRPEVAAHAGTDAAADEFVSPHCVGGATIQALYECRDCHCGQVGDEKVHVVGFAVELDQLESRSELTLCMVFSAKVRISSVNTGRRYLVANTRCACSNDTLCRVWR